MKEGPRLSPLLAIGLIGSILLFFAGYRWLPEPRNIPMYAGPPQFIVLSLIVAVGLYLRQVKLHALEQCEKIRDGKALNKPHERMYADEKLKQLEDTSNMIMIVSPFVIMLMLIVGFRIVADDVCRFLYDEHQTPRAFYGFDLVISVGLFFMLVGLAVAHFIARTQDGRIRRLIRSEEVRATLGP